MQGLRLKDSLHQVREREQPGEQAPEESKVKLWHRVSLLSDLKKRGASRVAHFLHSIFKEQAPPQSGEGSLLRWFWSFTGASRAVAARTGATIVVVPQPA
jgi:hypothetical protein